MPRLLLLGFSALLLWSCHDPETHSEAGAVVISRTAVVAYPSAVEVRLFVQDGRDVDGRDLFSDVDGRRLTSPERLAIERTFETRHYGPGDRWAAACFVPHHFLRYYDARGRKVGEIAICFCCAEIRADPGLQEQHGPSGTESSDLSFDYDALKSVIEAMGVRTDIECG